MNSGTSRRNPHEGIPTQPYMFELVLAQSASLLPPLKNTVEWDMHY